MTALLEPVGLGPIESSVYLALIDQPNRTLTELTNDTGIATGRLRRSIKRLVDCGLVTRLTGSPARYVPAPPERAVDALALRHQQDLENLRVTARGLARRLDNVPRGSASELIELVEGPQAIQQQLARIQLGAETEVCIVDCPPYMTGRPSDNPPEWNGLARGVTYRAIYHTPTITKERRTDEILRYMEAGEQARSLPDVDLKMIIVDQRIAMIPLASGPAETGVRILVHPSPLLNALMTCFDMLWERATPLGTETTTAHGPSRSDRQMLMMLAAGMKDTAIAHTLNIAERTVTRRLTELMRTLGADTRFQAALQASRRGWL